MKSYSVAWFEGSGLRPGIPDGVLPELKRAEFDSEEGAVRHAQSLIASGRHAVTLRGPGGLVLRAAELSGPAA